MKRKTHDAGGNTYDVVNPSNGSEGPSRLRARSMTKTAIQTVGEHWAATQALRRDEDLRIDVRETVRMRLGADGRLTKKRTNPKLVSVFVDPDATVFDEFIALVNAKLGAASEAPVEEAVPAFFVRQKRRS